MAADPEESFKVTDRRRRIEDSDPLPEPAPRSEAPHPQGAAQPPGHSSLSPERSLAGLFMMLASSAVMALGDAPDPVTGQVQRDLDQAAELIDLLVLLREKTEGKRSPEETQILEEIVYDLQVRYVAATRRSGSRPGPARS